MKPKNRHQSNQPAAGRETSSRRNGDGAQAAGLTGFLRSMRLRGWLFGLLLVAGTLLAYQPAWHAGFIWDDDAYVTHNPLLTAPDGLKRIWFSQDTPSQYFPLTYTTFRIERALWGLNPAGYHWTNILLHAANALLVWGLLRRLSVPGAWLAAAIFAVHPVHVESVAWITERKNVLSLFFFLLALHSWVEFVEERPKQQWRFYGLALMFQALALFSKTTACTLPAALLLILWLREKTINWRRLAQIVPFLALGLAMGLVTMWWERHNIGVQEKVQALGPLERILVASRAVWFYAGKLLWPANLTFSYPRWTINPAAPLAYSWLAAGAGLCVAICFARRWVGRSAEVATLFYVATLSPLLGFIMLTTFRWSFVADHYQYVASLGPLALAAAGITLALGRFGKWRLFLAPTICGALLVVLGGLTWQQSKMYRDLETLWRTTLERNPGSWMAHINLGQVLMEKRQVDKAMEHFQKALEIQPGNVTADNNIGSVLLQKGQADEAMAHWEKILQSHPDDPDVHNNLAAALFQKGRADEAIAHWRKTLQSRPADPNANNNLGTALFLKGQVEAAIAQFKKALKFNPDNAAACNGLAAALAQNGQTDQAIALFQKALQIQSNNAEAHFNLGCVLLQKRRVDEAIPHFQKVLEIQPDDEAAQSNLGRAAWMLATNPEASVRNGARAVELAQQLDRLVGGNNPTVLGTLAAAYAETGRFPEAIAAAQRALQVATAQTNAALVNALPGQIGLYQAGRPLRDTSQTNAPPATVKP